MPVVDGVELVGVDGLEAFCLVVSVVWEGFLARDVVRMEAGGTRLYSLYRVHLKPLPPISLFMTWLLTNHLRLLKSITIILHDHARWRVVSLKSRLSLILTGPTAVVNLDSFALLGL